jgi:hypothetical protein
MRYGYGRHTQTSLARQHTHHRLEEVDDEIGRSALNRCVERVKWGAVKKCSSESACYGGYGTYRSGSGIGDNGDTTQGGERLCNGVRKKRRPGAVPGPPYRSAHDLVVGSPKRVLER